MRSWLAVALAACASVPDGSIDQPILGGTPASAGQFPSVVEIVAGDGACTGTVIAPRWVLTAAHCVSPDLLCLTSQEQVTQSVRVHVGTVDVNAAPGAVVTATDTISDPLYDLNGTEHDDIGLIELAAPITSVTPVVLDFDQADAPVGVAVTTVGFGEPTSGVEYFVEQTSVPCATANETDAALLCFDQAGGRGVAPGDSGGPSFALVAGQLRQVGITSFIDPMVQVAGMTRIDAVRAFLVAHVPSLECQAQCASDPMCVPGTCIAAPDSPAGTPASGGGCDAGASDTSLAFALGAIGLVWRTRRRRSAR